MAKNGSSSFAIFRQRHALKNLGIAQNLAAKTFDDFLKEAKECHDRQDYDGEARANEKAQGAWKVHEAIREHIKDIK